MNRRRMLRRVAAGAALLAAAWSFATFWHHFKHAHGERGCAGNLQQIAQAIILYAHANEGRLPDSFETLALKGEVFPIGFVCPLTDDTAAAGPTTRAAAERLTDGGHLSYVYTGRGLTMDEVTEDTVLAFEPLSNHGHGLNVLLGDGHVEFLDARRGKAVAAGSAAGLHPVVRPRATPAGPENGPGTGLP